MNCHVPRWLMRMAPLRNRISRFLVLALLSWVVPSTNGDRVARGESPEILPGSQPLTIEQPLDEFMVDGLRKFSLQQIDRVAKERNTRWQAASQSGRESFQKFRDAKRKDLRTILGVVDDRIPTMGLSGLYQRTANTSPPANSVASHASPLAATAVPAQWPVLPGIHGDGLIWNHSRPRGFAIVLPDVEQQWTENPASMKNASVMADAMNRAGFVVVVPALIDRLTSHSGNRQVSLTNQSHREFLYRMSFELGRHVIGYEVQKVLALVDAFEHERTSVAEQNRELPILVVGTGEGGRIGLYAAAIDARIDGILLRGAFQPRETLWAEPIDRNIWNFLTDFGDAELAGLIAPRLLAIDSRNFPEYSGPARPMVGRRNGAAPGLLTIPLPEQIQPEIQRASSYFTAMNAHGSLREISRPFKENSEQPTSAIEKHARLFQTVTEAGDSTLVRPIPTDDWQLSERMFREIVDYNHRLLQKSSSVRDSLWVGLDRSSLEKFSAARIRYRDLVWDQLIGRLPNPSLPMNPRTRKVYDEPEFVGYEVLLDVHDEIVAGGVLLLPRTMNATEKRPVVVCQHGLEGTPRDTIDTQADNPKAYGPYKSFARELVKRGFIVYAPQNPYRGGDRFRELQRMANPVGKSLFSFILCQHQRTLEWLKTLPNVDAERIAFYGLSYGGKTAVRVPPLLDEYCLSICSADFNEWVLKNTTIDFRPSYLFTNEYEIFEWNMAHVANYGELSLLMAPRPFMVERGHDDNVAVDEWVAWEYAKVRRQYVKLGIGDRTAIEFFNGPHTINGQGTYDFLHRHLNWPVPKN